ncbi:hypothetical protein BTK96_001056 [Burkholderia pyrrocinia]|nr:hypothetical protein [Burkholderia pyrrocinia]EKS9892807.1 hypothetical protein [Burkholderia pyrrocinia]EKS9907682.1 hypothetical protein [Burkholderia pyrrocinia]
MKVFGYAYPSNGADAAVARTALEAAGAQHIFIEEPGHYPAGVSCPSEYTACMSRLSAGDKLFVYRLNDVLPLVLFGIPEAARVLVEEVGVEVQVLQGTADLTPPVSLEKLTEGIPGAVELFEQFGAPEAARDRLRHIPGSVGLAVKWPLRRLAAALAAERLSRELAKTNGPRRDIDLRGMPPPSPKRHAQV